MKNRNLPLNIWISLIADEETRHELIKNISYGKMSTIFSDFMSFKNSLYPFVKGTENDLLKPIVVERRVYIDIQCQTHWDIIRGYYKHKWLQEPENDCGFNYKYNCIGVNGGMYCIEKDNFTKTITFEQWLSRIGVLNLDKVEEIKNKYNYNPKSKQIDYRNQDKLKQNQLVENEIYYRRKNNSACIFRYSGEDLKHSGSIKGRDYYNKKQYNTFTTTSFGFRSLGNIYHATPGQKEWLGCCIDEDKFIRRDKVFDVKFSPEYVKSLKTNQGLIKHKVYKVEESGNGYHLINNTYYEKELFKHANKKMYDEQEAKQEAKSITEKDIVVGLQFRKTFDSTHINTIINVNKIKKTIVCEYWTSNIDYLLDEINSGRYKIINKNKQINIKQNGNKKQNDVQRNDFTIFRSSTRGRFEFESPNYEIENRSPISKSKVKPRFS